jgi:hypothetical protein
MVAAAPSQVRSCSRFGRWQKATLVIASRYFMLVRDLLAVSLLVKPFFSLLVASRTITRDEVGFSIQKAASVFEMIRFMLEHE